jgi:ribose/xylose/arabinose/galactoside ABC-type transport system permease subunit
VAPNLISPALRRRLLFLAAGNLGLLLLIFALLKPGSSFADVIARVGPDVAPTLIAALGLTGVIFTGAIDLSIASIIAVAGTVFGLMVIRHAPALLCFAAVLATTTLLSAFNGWLINRLRLPAIIITLGGLAAYRGLALILADAGQPDFPGYFPVGAGAYQGPGKGYPVVLLMLCLAGALIFEFAGRTPRHWLALGSDEEAVRLAGLSPAGIRQSAFGISGLFLGVAALIFLTRVTAIEPSRVALGFELAVIGAVILGGTNIFGGEGSYLGSALGACFLHLVGEALIFAGVSPYWREVFTGGVILAVIGLDCGLHRRRKLMEELA